jgi:hypothetical protein
MRSAAGLDERLAIQSNWKSATKVRNYLFFTPSKGKIGRIGADLWAAYYGKGPSIGKLFYSVFSAEKPDKLGQNFGANGLATTARREATFLRVRRGRN